MFNSQSFTDNLKRYSWLLVLPLIVGVFLSSCGDSPIDAQTDFTDSSATSVNNNIEFVPDQFDAVGTIQGTVIDKATGEALNDVAVSLNFKPADADEPSVLTDSTGSEGTFSFTGVPVNSDADYTSSGEGSFSIGNSPYTLKINAESYDNYRDLYRMNAALGFAATGGDGAATNLVSDVTIPLSEQAVTLKGKAHTDSNNPTALSDVKVELYQEFSPFINDNGIETDMLVDSATTGSDGSFTFEGVEEDADVWLLFRDDSDPSKVVNYDYKSIDDTPSAADGTNPEMNLGVIKVEAVDESGSFYITSVTPAPNSDLGDTDTSFVYEFNRPVAENAWTDASRGFGSGTFKDEIEFSDEGMKKSPGDLQFSVSWSDDRTELTITPEGLMDATVYELDVSGAFNSDFVDEYDNTLTYDESDYSIGEVEMLDFSIGVNSDSPHTPEIAHNAEEGGWVDYNSGTLTASWQVDESDVDVKKYEVFIKKGDQSYEHHADISRDQIDFGEAEHSIAPTYDNPVVEVKANDVPDESITHSYKVRAVSANLVEGEFSNEITFADSTQPDVQSTADIGNYNFVDVTFSEPMNKSQVEDPSNYTFENAEVADVRYDADYGSSSPSESYTARVMVGTPSDLSDGETLEVASEISDLAGNELDNNQVTLEKVVPHTPQLAADIDNSTVNWDGGSLTMSWEVNHEPVEVDEYWIYVSQDDGDPQVLETVDAENTPNWGEITYTLNGSNDRYNAFPTDNNEEHDLLIVDQTLTPVNAAHSYEVQIAAVEDVGLGYNIGQWSDPITVEDVTDPVVNNASYAGDEVTVRFSEPMVESEVEDSDNYTFSDSNITIDSIEYEGDNSPYQVVITVEDGTNLSGGQDVTVENVSDLSGNGIDTDNNSDTY